MYLQREMEADRGRDHLGGMQQQSSPCVVGTSSVSQISRTAISLTTVPTD